MPEAAIRCGIFSTIEMADVYLIARIYSFSKDEEAKGKSMSFKYRRLLTRLEKKGENENENETNFLEDNRTSLPCLISHFFQARASFGVEVRCP